MKNNYFLAAGAAVLLVLLGVFLIGRDGTDTEPPTLTEPQNVSENLPINPNASTTEEDLSEPILEEGDASTTPEFGELPNGDVEAGDTGIVTYTDAGFSPKTIEVSKGDTVTFTNNSSRNMWIASNMHPTHNEYPTESDEDCLGSSFDACIGIPVGESWSFTFDRIGEWGYHDHLSVSRTGTIIVE